MSVTHRLDMNAVVPTFHGRVYGKKLVRKESDLPADFTNASAATRRVFEPAALDAKQPAKDKRSVGPTASALLLAHRVCCPIPALDQLTTTLSCWHPQQTTQETCAQAHQQQW